MKEIEFFLKIEEQHKYVKKLHKEKNSLNFNNMD